MFLSFYGLKDQPFGVTPDPKYLFWSNSHREALASLYYGIESGCGFLSLIASPGMGKTTLLFHLLDRLRGASRTAYLFHTQCSSIQLLRYLMADLGCNDDVEDRVALYARLYEVLIAEARAGRRFVMVIDEAQNLDDSVLETIRLLSNFETPSRKLMQVVLAGQPQLSEKLARHELWQLRQRISIMSRIDPLAMPEVAEYIEHRIRIAGHDKDPLFTPESLELIATASKGIPRTINNLCFNSLTLGCAERQRTIKASIVRQVIEDLNLEKPDSLDAGPGDPIESKGSPALPASGLKQELPGPISPGMEPGVRRSKTGAAPLAKWMTRIRLRGLGPVLEWTAGHRRFAMAVLAAFLLLAVSISIYRMNRRPAELRESLVQAASAPSAAKAVPELEESQEARNQTSSIQYLTVTVESDENLDYISRKYLGRRLSVRIMDELLRLNPQIADPNRLEAGDRIRLPLSELPLTAPPAPQKKAAARE